MILYVFNPTYMLIHTCQSVLAGVYTCVIVHDLLAKQGQQSANLGVHPDEIPAINQLEHPHNVSLSLEFNLRRQ